MLDYFSPLSSSQVLIVGDLILDRYLYGETNRISPEAPVPIVKVHKTEERPGGAANVAMNISALGLGVQIIGITGDDESADTLELKLKQAEVVCNFVRQQGFPTVTKLRVLSGHQQLIRLDYESSAETADAMPLQKLFEERIRDVDLVLLSDYAKGSLQFTKDFIGLAKKREVRVLIDPKGNDFSRYQGASYLTPNLKEFESVVGECSNDEDMINKAHRLCEELELDGLLITRGEEGMSLVDAHNVSAVHLPAYRHEVFDVTGAGDTVIAVLAAALASSYDIHTATHYANFAAGLAVEKLGAVSIGADELNAAIREKSGASYMEGVVKKKDLLNLVASARSRNERIVMTNGCFDILHAGHVEYLQQAKKLGERLLVAVNSDSSVHRLKGEGRPITCVENRMAVLEALNSTDWIIDFSEDTPEVLIREIKPDVLVKGGDYLPEQIAGGEFVKSYGGELVTIPFKTNCSTSELINKIRKQAEPTQK
jgi:D-beta-D-heptose 7-phosphate kinase/D-beta-D-heptose 1-phosphate adenosyltransferase